jgi:colicin import membrane protein
MTYRAEMDIHMPAKEAKKGAPRPRRSKAETQQEFIGIQEEVEASQVDAKTAEATRLRETQVRQRVEGVTVESVVQKVSGLGLEVSRALADVSEKLSEEVELLAFVREAVTLERKELGQLHKIDVAATALDQLVQDYAREKQKLEMEIVTQRDAWEEETGRLGRERKELDEALKKQRQREIEDYEYKKMIDRKKAQDKYEEELRVRDKKNQEQQEALEKVWQKREAVLKEQDEEFARLKKEVTEFPARLLKETEAAALQGRREAEAKLEQQIIGLNKDAETEKRVAELQVKTLEEALARNATHIAALEKQLADAKQQVQDIAVKAIEGASGARALSHINQIAMEQAKNRPQG